jgi:cell division protein FtsI/penicillin-binding protein 2
MKKFTNWRINLVLILILIFGAAIFSRLFFVQILQGKLYGAQALGQQVALNSMTGPRGQIFCRSSQSAKGGQGSGEIKSLAVNKDNWLISVNPQDIPDKIAFADVLSKSIDISPDEILSELSSQGSSYVVIKKDLSSSDLQKIKALDFEGLSWQKAPDRFYPQGKTASQIIGFLGGAGDGQYGVEGYYNDILEGKYGVKEKKSGIDFLLSNNEQMSLNGSDLYLTIDYNIQFQAEELLKQEKIKNDIDSGQIIVMKPDTGKILALANFPNFDPKNY